MRTIRTTSSTLALALLAHVGIGLTTCVPSATAADKTWTGAVSTDWYDLWNWSPVGVPAGTDSLLIDSGPIDIAHEFTASNRVTWNNGAISGLLKIAKDGELTLATTGGKSFSGTLANAGTTRFYGSAWDGGRFGLEAGAGFNAPGIRNEAGARFMLGDNQTIYGTSAAWFANAGTLTKEGGLGTTQLGEPGNPLRFDNTGTVEIWSGQLGFWDYADSPAANIAVHIIGPIPCLTFSTPPTFLGQFTVKMHSPPFIVTPGASYEVLKYPSAAVAFTAMNGLALRGGLLLDPEFSPTNLVLRVIADWNYQVLHRFGRPFDYGLSPLSRVCEGSDGKLYGTTWRGGGADHGVLFKLNPDGSGYQELHHFFGYMFDAGLPWCGVIQGTNGLLYGTTMMGGLIPMPPDYNGKGAIYRIDTNGNNYEVLHSFNGTNGATPRAELLQASDGWLYGTTEKGGTSDGGTVFRIQPDGHGFTVLHDFGNGVGGFFPQAPLVEGKDGLLYGSTPAGPFKMSKDGSYFSGAPGLGSWAPLLGASNGLIYGTTPWVGPAFTDKGKVFCGTPSGVVVLHAFTGPDGCHPGNAGVVEGPDGLLYGTTVRGGTHDLGVLYRLRKDGAKFKVLHHFRGFPNDGQLPMAGVVLNRRGDAFYATARGDENRDSGIIFRYGHHLGMGRGSGAAAIAGAGSRSVKDGSGLGLNLKLTGIPGLTYQLQRSTDLLHWTNLWSRVLPESLLIDYEDPDPPPDAAFYRANLVR